MSSKMSALAAMYSDAEATVIVVGVEGVDVR
jgi:hypothetical protein